MKKWNIVGDMDKDIPDRCRAITNRCYPFNHKKGALLFMELIVLCFEIQNRTCDNVDSKEG